MNLPDSASELARSPVAISGEDRSGQGIADDIEEALRIARVILVVFASVVIAGFRPVANSGSWVTVAFQFLGMAVGVLFMNTLSTRVPLSGRWMWLIQSLDVLGAALIMLTIDSEFRSGSWAVLLIPVVVGAVRSGTTAAMLSWLGGCLAFLMLTQLGLLESVTDAEDLIRAPAMLLAISVTIGLVARWMRAGWERQQILTEHAAERERRLAALESTSRALMNTTIPEALSIAAAAAVDLGFDTATVRAAGEATPNLVAGTGRHIAQVDPTLGVAALSVVVSSWVQDNHVKAHSAQVLEPGSDMVVAGWSPTPIGEDLARALVALVGQTSGAVKAAKVTAHLKDAASRDGLTGALNRRAFDDRLYIAASSGSGLALAFVDLDHFETINDTYGHQAGDQALIRTAATLAETVGDEGVVARFGGDEFAVIIPGCSHARAAELTDRMLERTSEPIRSEGHEFSLTLSMGVAVSPTVCEPFQLLELADAAVYEAKRRGRANRVIAALRLPSVESRDPLADPPAVSPKPSLGG
ncbi:MAG: GGDEF domain-containing protein [Actinomycetia bacterium]|nr:GGDEF domain-containing protein [Actinomycetes bacterium]